MKKYAVRFLTLVMSITVMVTMATSANAVSTPFPFTMIVANASHDINTMNNSAKRFTKANITEDSITAYGKIILNHVEGKYTAGIGYLNGDEISGAPELYVSNRPTNAMFNTSNAVMYLVAGRTYFLYAENDSLYSCTMHGTVSADVFW